MDAAGNHGKQIYRRREQMLPAFSHVCVCVCVYMCVFMCRGKAPKLEVGNSNGLHVVKGEQESQVEQGETWKS